MTPSECVVLCEYIHAAVPQQKWAPGTPDVWYDLGLSDVGYYDAREAVRTMVRGRVFIDFQGIVDTVRKLRTARLAGVDSIQPPADLDPDDTAAFQAWQRATIAAVAAGTLTPPPDDGPAAVPAKVSEALTNVGRRVPPR